MIAATMLALAAATAACDWTDRGRDPYVGDVPAAVERYADIPPATRAELRRRMAARQWDDIAVIRRDGIAGARQYTGLRDMHFGSGRVCRGAVDTSRWRASDEELGLVYCADGHCLIVPTVCRNVSRITQLPPTRRALLEVPGGTGSAMPGTDITAELTVPAGPLHVPQLTLAGPPVAFSADDGVGELMADAPGFGAARAMSMPGGAADEWHAVSGGFRVPVSLPAVAAVTAGLPAIVEPIPEPNTWRLMAIGLIAVALIGLARRINEHDED